jgi:hypothetical protein
MAAAHFAASPMIRKGEERIRAHPESEYDGVVDVTYGLEGAMQVAYRVQNGPPAGPWTPSLYHAL